MCRRTWWVPLVCLLMCVGCGKKKSTDDLVAELQSGQEHDRVAAVRSLPVSEADAAKVVPALVEALKDRSPEVRHGAAVKLGSFGDRARNAIPALEAALNDRDPRVREAAAVALSRIDPQRPRPEPAKRR